MMKEEDRKKVFWLLKKYSSYTAWKSLGDAYAEFAKNFEYSVVHADETNEFETDTLKDILDGQIAFEKGLPRLCKGQRNVFLNNSTGYLASAANEVYSASCIMDPEEYVFDWMKNKVAVLAAYAIVESRISGLFCARDRLTFESPAAFGQKTVFDPLYAPFNFPPRLLDVPEPEKSTVNTGEETPISGIWEPEWEASQDLLKPLSGATAKTEKGCMNYLVAGALAPKYKDSDGSPIIDVTWRLIWADHRYEDGTIPEEEKEYLAEAAPTQADQPLATARLRAEPNELVPKTGWWHSPAKPNGQALHYFEAGQRFPDIHTTNYGSVIWGYDPNEQKAAPKK